MTAHDCTEITEGCYRCELSKDEMAAIHEENRLDAKAAWMKHLIPSFTASELRIAHDGFIAGFIAGRES